VYSVLGDGEWIMETRPINRTDYAKVPAFFNPINFDPAAWVALVKAAGMKYITSLRSIMTDLRCSIRA